MKIVISQPMYFPWVGMFEQIALADAYVHYSDVQFSKGSFSNRVQIKTVTGSKWLTIPLGEFKLGQLINQVLINNQSDWREQHRRLLTENYHQSPYFNDMMNIVNTVLSNDSKTISEISEASIASVCDYYRLNLQCKFLHSSKFDKTSSGSQRVLDIVREIGGTEYITGHGAKNYLDHKSFEQEGIRISYINYLKKPYKQLHGTFTPFVTILDLIANLGPEGRSFICSGTVSWKDFLANE